MISLTTALINKNNDYLALFEKERAELEELPDDYANIKKSDLESYIINNKQISSELIDELKRRHDTLVNENPPKGLPSFDDYKVIMISNMMFFDLVLESVNSQFTYVTLPEDINLDNLLEFKFSLDYSNNDTEITLFEAPTLIEHETPTKAKIHELKLPNSIESLLKVTSDVTDSAIVKADLSNLRSTNSVLFNEYVDTTTNNTLEVVFANSNDLALTHTHELKSDDGSELIYYFEPDVDVNSALNNFSANVGDIINSKLYLPKLSVKKPKDVLNTLLLNGADASSTAEIVHNRLLRNKDFTISQQKLSYFRTSNPVVTNVGNNRIMEMKFKVLKDKKYNFKLYNRSALIESDYDLFIKNNEFGNPDYDEYGLFVSSTAIEQTDELVYMTLKIEEIDDEDKVQNVFIDLILTNNPFFKLDFSVHNDEILYIYETQETAPKNKLLISFYENNTNSDKESLNDQENIIVEDVKYTVVVTDMNGTNLYEKDVEAIEAIDANTDDFKKFDYSSLKNGSQVVLNLNDGTNGTLNELLDNVKSMNVKGVKVTISKKSKVNNPFDNSLNGDVTYKYSGDVSQNILLHVPQVPKDLSVTENKNNENNFEIKFKVDNDSVYNFSNENFVLEFNYKLPSMTDEDSMKIDNISFTRMRPLGNSYSEYSATIQNDKLSSAEDITVSRVLNEAINISSVSYRTPSNKNVSSTVDPVLPVLRNSILKLDVLCNSTLNPVTKQLDVSELKIDTNNKNIDGVASVVVTVNNINGPNVERNSSMFNIKFDDEEGGEVNIVHIGDGNAITNGKLAYKWETSDGVLTLTLQKGNNEFFNNISVTEERLALSQISFDIFITHKNTIFATSYKPNNTLSKITV
jgi:hypothetical protein